MDTNQTMKLEELKQTLKLDNIPVNAENILKYGNRELCGLFMMQEIINNEGLL